MGTPPSRAPDYALNFVVDVVKETALVGDIAPVGVQVPAVAAIKIDVGMVPCKLAPVSDSNIIITGRLTFWGNYFLPTPVSLWRSDLEPKDVSDHCYTRSDDLLVIGSDGEYGSPAQKVPRWFNKT